MYFKNNREQGYYFEKIASEIITSKGYKIIDKNYYTRYGEIDLIAKNKNLIIFVEVKQRSSNNFGFGENSIDYKKRRRIFLSAKQFLYKNNLFDFSIRFDAIIFYKKNNYSYKWLKNIIWGDEFGF
ncbi:MAG: YraN family protein [Fusobacterium sp. JB019]|nr:YraN family protein [Fusobacterium sp. JB020]MDP0506958.1 YraN family protein [Fusobacterium sp. JB019]